MDARRLDTLAVINSGILNVTAPDTEVPKDREEFSGSGTEDWSYVGDAAVIEALDTGKLVTSSNYYGIPYAWRDGDTYRGILLQYRAVTEDRTFANAADAAEWFGEMYHSTDG